MHFLTDRTAHTTSFDAPIVDHWLEWKIAQTANPSTMQDRSAMQEDPNIYSKVLYRVSHILPLLLGPDNIYGHMMTDSNLSQYILMVTE